MSRNVLPVFIPGGCTDVLQPVDYSSASASLLWRPAEDVPVLLLLSLSLRGRRRRRHHRHRRRSHRHRHRYLRERERETFCTTTKLRTIFHSSRPVLLQTSVLCLVVDKNLST
jgi:hypothetical protein